MIAFLLDVLVVWAGTVLGLVVTGAVVIWLLCAWADDDDLWPASRSCDNVDGGA